MVHTGCFSKCILFVLFCFHVLSFFCLVGIEAADLTSLLEQFEETQGDK